MYRPNVPSEVIPMKHHGLKAALLTVLSALLVGSLVQAADPENEQDAKKSMTLLTQELRAHRQEMEALRQEIKADRKEQEARYSRLMDRLRQLEERVDRVASAPPPASRRGAPPASRP